MEKILETNKLRTGQQNIIENKLFGEKTFETNTGLIRDNPYFELFSKDEQDSLRQFHKYLEAFDMDVSRARRSIIIQRLFLIRKNGVEIQLNRISEENIGDVLNSISKFDIAPTTRQGFRQALRKYLTWREYGTKTKQQITLKGYPTVVKLIPNGIPKNEKRKINVKETLTRDELAKMIQSATSVRNKAVICLLIETGARVGEIENLRIRDLTYKSTPPRFEFDLFGKTGHRQSMCVEYFRYLNDWVTQHPLRDSENFKEQPLFVSNGKEMGSYTALSYNSINNLLKRTAKIAGINKPVNPHNFRHTWVTMKDQEGWSLSEIANAVGWSKNSRQFANYSHTSSKTSMDKRLETLGAKPKVYESTSIICGAVDCKAINSKSDGICWQCNQPLKTGNKKVFGEYKEMEEVIFERLLRRLAPEGTVEPTAKFSRVDTRNYQIGDIL
jgi:integrase